MFPRQRIFLLPAIFNPGGFIVGMFFFAVFSILSSPQTFFGIKASPKSARSTLELAELRFIGGDFEEATQMYNKALFLKPTTQERARALAGRGLVSYKEGRTQSAKADLVAAKALFRELNDTYCISDAEDMLRAIRSGKNPYSVDLVSTFRYLRGCPPI